MSIGRYLKDKTVGIFVGFLYLVFLYIFIDVVVKSRFAAIFISGGYILTLVFIAGYDYWKKKRYYENVLDTLASIDQKTLIGSLLPNSSFLESELLEEILKVATKGMNDQIQKYKLISRDYREYIELWIHEVKTPIASSRLILQNNEDTVSGRLGEDLDELERYVEQALYYARSSSVEKDYMVKACVLEDIINPVIRRNRRDFIEKKIRLEIENVSLQVFTDSKWVEFILNQIIGNAIKYKGEQPEICIKGEVKDNLVCLYISDNGMGIRSEDLPRVMEKGFTGVTGRLNRKATGMGLYLCKNLCDKLGLGIEIQSEVSKGTTVMLYFPISESSILLG